MKAPFASGSCCARAARNPDSPEGGGDAAVLLAAAAVADSVPSDCGAAYAAAIREGAATAPLGAVAGMAGGEKDANGDAGVCRCLIATVRCEHSAAESGAAAVFGCAC